MDWYGQPHSPDNILCRDTDWSEAQHISGLGQYTVDTQKFIEGETYPTKPAEWLLGDELVQLYAGDSPFTYLNMQDASKSVKVSDMATLGPIATSYKASIAAGGLKNNGKLPSKLQVAAALCSPHTRDIMVDRLSELPDGEVLADQVWKDIQEEVETLMLARLICETQDAQKKKQTTAAPRAPAPSDVETDSDEFGASRRRRKKRQAPDTGVQEQPNRSLAQQAALLASQEMTRWRTPVEDATKAAYNTIDKPLLPRSKSDYFNAVTWFLEKNSQGSYKRAASYQGFMRVAITYLIVHATAARAERTFSWAGIVATAKRANMKPTTPSRRVFLRRNKKYRPTSKQMKAEYLRRREAKVLSAPELRVLHVTPGLPLGTYMCI